MTEAAVKQHLLRLYQKLKIAEGPNRRVRLANEVIALGLVRPLPPAEPAAHPPRSGPADRGEPVPSGAPASRRREPDRAVKETDGAVKETDGAVISTDATQSIGGGLGRAIGEQANGTGQRVS